MVCSPWLFQCFFALLIPTYPTVKARVKPTTWIRGGKRPPQIWLKGKIFPIVGCKFQPFSSKTSPICSMVPGIFTNIYPKNGPNVGENTSTMEQMAAYGIWNDMEVPEMGLPFFLIHIIRIVDFPLYHVWKPPYGSVGQSFCPQWSQWFIIMFPRTQTIF